MTWARSVFSIIVNQWSHRRKASWWLWGWSRSLAYCNQGLWSTSWWWRLPSFPPRGCCWLIPRAPCLLYSADRGAGIHDRLSTFCRRFHMTDWLTDWLEAAPELKAILNGNMVSGMAVRRRLPGCRFQHWRPPSGCVHHWCRSWRHPGRPELCAGRPGRRRCCRTSYPPPRKASREWPPGNFQQGLLVGEAGQVQWITFSNDLKFWSLCYYVSTFGSFH